MASSALINPFPELIETPGINHIALDPVRRLCVLADTAMGLQAFHGETLLWTKYLGSDNDKIRPTQRIRALSLSGDSLFVAAGDSIDEYEVESGDIAWSHTPPRSWGFLITSPVAVAHDRDTVVAAFDNGTLGRWNRQTFRSQIKHLNDTPRWLGLHGDEIIGSDGYSLTVWDRESLTPLTHQRLRTKVHGLALSPVGSRVALTTLHGIEIWDWSTHQPLFQISTRIGRPAICFNASGSLYIAESGRLSQVTPQQDVSTIHSEDLKKPLCCTHDELTGSTLVGDAHGQVVSLSLK
jgi:hypothetical protein